MTRKDYELIAAVIRREKENDENKTLTGPELLEVIAYELAVCLQNDNPAFKMRRFLVACGLEE